MARWLRPVKIPRSKLTGATSVTLNHGAAAVFRVCLLYTSTPVESPAVKALRVGWMAKKAQVFAGNQHKPDVEDPDTVNHLNWYESTGFKVPYPGETKVRPASDFNRAAPAKADDDD